MERPLIVAMAAAAVVLAGLGCASDLARATSGVIGCAPEDIAIDDVSVGWSETSWAAACGGTSFRCAGERAPWCAPATVVPATVVPATVVPVTSGRAAPPESGSTEIPAAPPLSEGITDAPP